MRRYPLPLFAVSALSFGLSFGLLSPTAARADVTSWFALGGGYGLQRDQQAGTFSNAGAFTASIGVGSSSRASVVVGGMFRSVTYFSLGTDLSLSARIASGGFARGNWGVAVDLGVVDRFWRNSSYGDYPLQGIVTLGAPWGIQLGVGTQLWNIAGSPTAVGGFAVLELDFLRLTVMRQGGTDRYWFNPSPAGGRPASSAPGPSSPPSP